MVTTEQTLKECNALLFAMIGNKELVEVWWLSSNLAFGGKTPESVFLYDPNSVLRYIWGSCDGYW